MGGKIRGMFSSMGSQMHGMFQGSKSKCGCNGAYFDECVGYDYGNSGMQSCVSGCGDVNPSSEPGPEPTEIPAAQEPEADAG